MGITVGDYVQTIDNDFCTISGEVVEDNGNKVVIIDDAAETDDDRLEFHKSELETIQKLSHTGLHA